eukprot:jgi/Mesen1/392/ME000010S_10851
MADAKRREDADRDREQKRRQEEEKEEQEGAVKEEAGRDGSKVGDGGEDGQEGKEEGGALDDGGGGGGDGGESTPDAQAGPGGGNSSMPIDSPVPIQGVRLEVVVDPGEGGKEELAEEREEGEGEGEGEGDSKEGSTRGGFDGRLTGRGEAARRSDSASGGVKSAPLSDADTSSEGYASANSTERSSSRGGAPSGEGPGAFDGGRSGPGGRVDASAGLLSVSAAAAAAAASSAEPREKVVVELPAIMVQPLRVARGVFKITSRRICFILDDRVHIDGHGASETGGSADEDWELVEGEVEREREGGGAQVGRAQKAQGAKDRVWALASVREVLSRR